MSHGGEGRRGGRRRRGGGWGCKLHFRWGYSMIHGAFPWGGFHFPSLQHRVGVFGILARGRVVIRRAELSFSQQGLTGEQNRQHHFISVHTFDLIKSDYPSAVGPARRDRLAPLQKGPGPRRGLWAVDSFGCVSSFGASSFGASYFGRASFWTNTKHLRLRERS